MASPLKRQQIMQAAERLFTSRRFHEITLDDVSRDAGVGKGTIYRYFHDKDDLFFQTASQGFAQLCELLSQIPTQGRFGDRLLLACRQTSDFFRSRRQWLRMMQSEDARMSWCPPNMRQHWLESRQKLARALAAIIQAGVAEGCIRGDIPPETLAHFLLGMLRTKSRELSTDLDESQALELVVDLFVNGCGRNAPAAPGPVEGSAEGLTV